MKRRDFIRCASVVGAATLLRPSPSWGQFFERASWIERARPMMATLVSIAVFDDPGIADSAVARAFDFIATRVSELSSWDRDSAVGRLNAKGRLAHGDVPASLARLAAEAAALRASSRGLFEPLSWNLSQVWRDAKTAGSVPDKQQLAAVMRPLTSVAAGFSVGPDALVIPEYTGFDVGGIGKVFIADLAIEFLRSIGVRYARVACSGDIHFLGDTEWAVDIEHPRGEGMLGSVRLKGSCAISTSGDYRNCWWVNGRRYHHLLDPRTGQPASAQQQLTVVAPTAAAADALATGLYALPSDKASGECRRLGLAGVFVDHAGSVSASPSVQFERSSI